MAIVNNKIVSTHFCCECCKHFRPFDSDNGTPSECWRFPGPDPPHYTVTWWRSLGYSCCSPGSG
jgi:hypothetical protein